MLRLLLPFIVVISLSACSNSSKRRNTPYISSNASQPFQFKPPLLATNDGKSTSAQLPLANQLSTNTTTNVNTTTNNISTTTAKPVTATAGMNPNHGQPGHRCDLAVGAPLTTIQQPATSSATVPTKPVANQSITVPQTPPVAKAVTATAGTNPSHGQPGHRCDISVGAPLNSAPVTASSPANQVTASTPNQVLPVPNQLQANPANKNVKVNPAHGQPGHDCTIAVGQPLKN